MALPLAGGLLLAGAGSYLAGRLQDMMNERETERETARRQSAISEFLGNAPQFELPPDQAGPQIQGQGLLGAIDDPRRRDVAKAYGGLLAIPGFEQMAAQGLMGAVSGPKPNIARVAVEAGLTPGTPDYQKFVRDATMKPQVSINNAPTGYMPIDPNDPSRGLTAIPGGPADPENPKNITEGQRLATAFANRMRLAEQDIGKLAVQTDGGTSPYTPSLGEQTAAGIPIAGNYLTSKEYQKYKQAARNWTTALLRKESGAAIPDSEWESYFMTFFPQPGDGPEVVAQKQQARLLQQQFIESTGAPGGSAQSAAAPPPPPGFVMEGM